MRRRCGGCGTIYHIPNHVMHMLQKQGCYPECPICNSTVSVKAEPIDMRLYSDATVQSHF